MLAGGQGTSSGSWVCLSVLPQVARQVLYVSCFIMFYALLRGYQIAFILEIMSVSDSTTHSSINDTFTLVSWNVKGFCHVIKRG